MGRGDGTLQVSEIKYLFSKLLGVPADQIADDQAEVMKFVGMKTDEMIETLMTKVDREDVDQYYKAMFPEQYIQEGLNEDEKIDQLCFFFERGDTLYVDSLQYQNNPIMGMGTIGTSNKGIFSVPRDM